MKKLVIDRKRWLRGTGSSNSRLLDSNGKMCCLGFLAVQNGATNIDILDYSNPSACSRFYNMELVMGTAITNLCRKLIDINDSIDLTPEYRESKLIELFKTIDYEVEFI